MLSKKSWIIQRYFELYEFVARDRLQNKDIDTREIHTLLVVVLSTGMLMWGYAVLAAFTISSPVPGYVGFVCASVHLLSPLLFRVTNNSYIPSNVLLASGMIHQGTFAFYTGGFLSNILIWFGILPMLGGVISGKKGAVTWMIITIASSLVFFTLHLNDFIFPDVISVNGRLLSQMFLVFGWIYLSSSIVIVYSELRKHTEDKLQEQGQKIEDLFRVLFHDLANPLGRFTVGLTILKRDMPEVEKNRGMEIAQESAESMLQITQNVRKMYAVRKGKDAVDLTYVPLNSCVEYVMKIYKEDLERKKIKLNYHFDKYSGLHLYVEPVSFKNQVLGNIISNAIKFSTPESSIHFEVLPLQDGGYELKISDSGIGIPDSLIKHLFDISKKTTRTGTQGEKGSGIGMHIMKSFVEFYGGNLLVESVESSGTTVRLNLKGEWKKMS